MLLPGTTRTAAFTVAERIRIDAREALRDRVTEARPDGHTLSGGIAVRPEDGTNAEQLFEHATRGLARARAHGGDSISLYHSERRSAIRFPVRPSARVAVTSDTGVTAARTRALDLSEHGALLEVDARFESADRVHVYVRRTGGDGDSTGWSAFASVVRREDRPGGRRRMGVEFERPVPRAALRQFAFSVNDSPRVGSSS
jgi:hypothetical protein